MKMLNNRGKVSIFEDEYCDLTWDEVVDKIGERVL